MRADVCAELDSECYPPVLSAGHSKEEPGTRYWKYVSRHYPCARDFNISLRNAFSFAEEEVPSISVRRGVLGGSPCIEGTRVPVYMILDAIEYYGSLEGVQKSYPHLNLDQIRDAVRFSKVVMECSVEH